MEPLDAAVRVVSWNCNMALARNASGLLAVEPDIAVVQECASSAELDGLDRVGWTGRPANKGLAVFARPSLGAIAADEVWDPTPRRSRPRASVRSVP